MVRRITIDDAAANFSEIVERARENGDSYVVERDGRAMCRILPPDEPPAKLSTLGQLLDELDGLAKRDPMFAEEVGQALEGRAAEVPSDKWES